MLDVEVARRKLQNFIEEVCNDQSLLYEAVCREILHDAEVLEIMRFTPLEQPGPNLFLAAVHFLLLRGLRHELREFYGTCSASPRPPTNAWPAFRNFCLTHAAEIVAIMASRRVQTNEVRRCSYLFPAFSIVHALQPRQPLAIIEIGASAGLNLNWDRYAYDYGGAGRFGDSSSPVVIRSDWRGNGPVLTQQVPPVAYRVGIDLHPIDLNDSDQALWLQALVWPDQPERLQLQGAAIEEFRRCPTRLVAGNALQVLPAELSKVPANMTLCLLHCHTLNQFTPADRAALDEIIRKASHDRPLTILSAEWIQTPRTELRLTNWNCGSQQSSLLANVDHHGRWIEWKR